MSPRDPFEAFRQSADQERVFPFQEEDWKDLEQRLEATHTPKSSVYPSPWWLVALLIPVLGLLLNLHYRGQTQYAINHQLLSEIEQLRTELSVQPQPITIIKYDTVVLERVVYRDHPTINTDVVLSNNFLSGPNNFSRSSYSSLRQSKFLQQPADPTFLTPATTSGTALLPTRETSTVLSKKELAAANALAPKNNKQSAIFPLPSQAITKLALSNNLFDKLPAVQPSLLHLQKLAIVKQPLIRSLDLTLVGGESIPSKPLQANLLSIHLGARLNARLGHGWMLFSGLATRISIYELDQPEPSIGSPVVDAPVEGYTLDDIQVQEVSNWWLLGAGWVLPSRKRWRPYFEFSYRKPFSHVSELTYAFQSPDGPESVVK